jgi:hypothetical protein
VGSLAHAARFGARRRAPWKAVPGESLAATVGALAAAEVDGARARHRAAGLPEESGRGRFNLTGDQHWSTVRMVIWVTTIIVCVFIAISVLFVRKYEK